MRGIYASCGTTYPQVKVLPDLTVPVTRRSFALKVWRVSLAAMYTSKPVIPDAFRPQCEGCGRKFGSAQALTRHSDDNHPK